MVISGRLSLLLVLAAAAGCVSATSLRTAAISLTASSAAASTMASAAVDEACTTCAPATPDSSVARALEKRLAELRALGGVCSSYGTVLENSYRSGQIIIRPYMWRVGAQLTSGEAKPNGEMILAREIDPLNVGLRTLDDLVRTMEHEAAHIAFRVDNNLTSDRADDYVRACREKDVTTPS